MTAFARSELEHEEGLLIWEIRSVNHRYLDVSFKMPEELKNLEVDLKNKLKNKVFRGKLECALHFKPNANQTLALKVNEPLVKALLKAGDALTSDFNVKYDLTVTRLMQWSGVLSVEKSGSETLKSAILETFEAAISILVNFRQQEGQGLKENILFLLDELNMEVAEIEKGQCAIQSLLRERIISRVESMNLAIENNRLEQEVALLAQKADISEEIERLKLHLKEVNNMMQSDKAIGRRLDFLAQELHRETNTLGAKSIQASLSKHVVDMKVTVEKIREQAQNIE